MKFRDVFKLKYLALSFGIGIAFMFAFYPLINLIGGEQTAVLIAMWPGAILSWLSGYGGHDLLGLLFYFVGNIVFYWAIAFLGLAGWLSRRHNSPNNDRGIGLASKHDKADG